MLKAQILQEERGAADYVIEEGELEDLFTVEEEIVVVEEEIGVQEEAVAENNVEEAVVNDAIVEVRLPRLPPPAPRFTPVIECFACNYDPDFDGHLLTDCYYSMITLTPANLAHFLKFQFRCFRCFQKAGFGPDQHNSMKCKHPRWCNKHFFCIQLAIRSRPVILLIHFFLSPVPI